MEIYSKKNGEFSFPYVDGFISIFAEKNGFYGSGASIFAKKNSNLNKINLILEAKDFFISGSLTDGINFIKNTKIDLYDINKNKIVASTFSNNEGFYNFLDLPFIEKTILIVGNYKSEVFCLDKDYLNFNIFFQKNKLHNKKSQRQT